MGVRADAVEVLQSSKERLHAALTGERFEAKHVVAVEVKSSVLRSIEKLEVRYPDGLGSRDRRTGESNRDVSDADRRAELRAPIALASGRDFKTEPRILRTMLTVRSI